MNIPLPKVNKMQKVGSINVGLLLREPEFPPTRGYIGFEVLKSPFSRTFSLTAGPMDVTFFIRKGRGETIEGLIRRASRAGARTFRF